MLKVLNLLQAYVVFFVDTWKKQMSAFIRLLSENSSACKHLSPITMRVKGLIEPRG